VEFVGEDQRSADCCRFFSIPLWYGASSRAFKRDNAARDIQETAEEEARKKILQDEKMKDIVLEKISYYVKKNR